MFLSDLILIFNFSFLLMVNMITVLILSHIKKIKGKCWIYFIVLIALHMLLVMNTSDWNEGAMSGSSYILPILKPATDTFYGLILISIFSAFIPMIIYIALIIMMVIFFCRKNVNRLFTDDSNTTPKIK